MTWEGALLVFVSLLVCAELYSFRSAIKNLHDEIEKLNETYRRKVIDQMDKQLYNDDERKRTI